MEHFVGLLKQETYYGINLVDSSQLKGPLKMTSSGAMKANKEKLNGLSPIEYR